jgi:SAM-dependent methyltransferase
MEIVKRLIPTPLKQRIKTYREDKERVRLFGDLAPLVPPVKSMFDGTASLSDFKANGEEFLKIYKDVCGLKADESMLDVGSGIGRKTLPLTQYFSERGLYQGMNVTKAGVDWCRDKISSRFPNFHFQHIDVYNNLYNPNGRTLPGEFRFPFEDESFNFVMLGSVFTHMLPAELEHYLFEIRRVMKTDGRCLISYFLLNDESLSLIEAGKSTLDFKYVHEEYRVVSEETPEAAIAFDQQWVERLYQKLGLKIKRLDFGSWCGREHYLSYQDLVLAFKV